MYKVVLSKSVSKFILKHPDLNKKLIASLELLAQNPRDVSKVDCKPLKWWSWAQRRLRVWKYRFFYAIDDWVLQVYFYDAWSRGNVYKKL